MLRLILSLAAGVLSVTPSTADACSIVFGRRPVQADLAASHSVVIGRLESQRFLPEAERSAGVTAVASIVTVSKLSYRGPDRFEMAYDPTGDPVFDCPNDFPLNEREDFVFLLADEVEDEEGRVSVPVIAYYPARVLILPPPELD